MSDRTVCQTGRTPEQARAEHDEMMVKALEFAQQDRDRLAARVAELEAKNGKLTNSVHNDIEKYLSALPAAEEVERWAVYYEFQDLEIFDNEGDAREYSAEKPGTVCNRVAIRRLEAKP